MEQRNLQTNHKSMNPPNPKTSRSHVCFADEGQNCLSLVEILETLEGVVMNGMMV